MTGYSGTPLLRKLGIKPEHRVLLVNAPDGFELAPLPPGVLLDRRAGGDPYDVILAFCADQAALLHRFDDLRQHLDRAGGLWIAWPKKSSGIRTDLTENLIRDHILPTGMVDNKVCAIDDTWSGLRLVIRLENR